jgi:hypothetical protein
MRVLETYLFAPLEGSRLLGLIYRTENGYYVHTTDGCKAISDEKFKELIGL